MEYYFYLIFIISLVALFGSLGTNNVKNDLPVVFTSFFTIILFQSIRKWTVGVDIVTYLHFFEQIIGGESINNINEQFSIEKGFLFYNKLVSLFTSDNQVFLAIVSASIFIPIGYVIYKNSSNLYLSIISLLTLGIFNFTFSGIRQSLALAIAFLSFEFIKKSKLIWFILLVILASTIHTSALVFIVAYPLYYLKINKSQFILIIILIIVTYVFKSYLFIFFVSTAFDRYDKSELTYETGAYTMFIVMLLIYSLSILAQSKEKFSVKLNAYSNYMLLAVFFQIGASESQVAMRAGYYYYIFMALLLPEIIATFKVKRIRDGLVFITVIICLVFYYLTTSPSNLNPYIFYWE